MRVGGSVATWQVPLVRVPPYGPLRVVTKMLAHQIKDKRGEGAANFRAGNVFEPDPFTPGERKNLNPLLRIGAGCIYASERLDEEVAQVKT